LLKERFIIKKVIVYKNLIASLITKRENQNLKLTYINPIQQFNLRPFIVVDQSLIIKIEDRLKEIHL